MPASPTSAKPSEKTVTTRATRGGLFQRLAHLRARHHHKRVVDRRRAATLGYA
jgi:hypothetical protein